VALLSVHGLSAAYGPLQVLWAVDLEVGAGESVALLGANGAGKTTLLRAILGLVPVLAGEVTFDGQELGGLAPDARVRRGLAYMSEIGVFPDLTVDENLEIGAFALPRAQVAARMAEVLALFPDLAGRRRALGRSLSGGQRKMLGVAKALMGRPRLMVMDEPSAGLAPRMVGAVFEILARLREQGLGLLVAEQNVRFLDLADRAYILEGGRVRGQGRVEDLRRDDAVRRAYFGLEEA
jgi:branched-chain amino acid transport system ATP-binding protein